MCIGLSVFSRQTPKGRPKKIDTCIQRWVLKTELSLKLLELTMKSESKGENNILCINSDHLCHIFFIKLIVPPDFSLGFISSYLVSCNIKQYQLSQWAVYLSVCCGYHRYAFYSMLSKLLQTTFFPDVTLCVCMHFIAFDLHLWDIGWCPFRIEVADFIRFFHFNCQESCCCLSLSCEPFLRFLSELVLSRAIAVFLWTCNTLR